MSFSQKQAFGDGEWFKFRVHYGFVTAGYATLEVNDANLNGREVFHIKGEGKTVGVSKLSSVSLNLPLATLISDALIKNGGVPGSLGFPSSNLSIKTSKLVSRSPA